MKEYGGVDVYILIFLTSALVGGEWSASRPGRFFLFGLWGFWHCDLSWPIMPASGDSEDDCGEADGM
jgi:hypothetical protein